VSLAAAHHTTAFVIVFAAFVVLSLVLIGLVVRFAVKLDRDRKAAIAAASKARKRRRPPSKPGT
jgi:predicted permease